MSLITNLKLGALDDLILNCFFHIESPLLDDKFIVGYAHNFIDIFNTENYASLCRVSSFPCVLFSLAFHSSVSSELLISSGTAFGKIFLWEISYDGNKKVAFEKPKHDIDAHTGVVFRMSFSDDGQYLGSVSDDRSVRLWDVRSGTQLAVCWGHQCRTWDIIFFNYLNRIYFASSGEDLSIKLWTLNGDCVLTLHGHSGRHIWRICYVPTRQLLVSGGNDSSIKLWPFPVYWNTCSLTHPKLVCPFPRQSPTSTSTFPSVGSETAADRTKTHKGSGVSTMALSPDGKCISIVTLEGSLWMVTIDGHGRFRWMSGPVLYTNVSASSISFQADCCRYLLAFDDGSVRFIAVLVPTHAPEENVHHNIPLTVSGDVGWKAHATRAINLWHLYTMNECIRSPSLYGSNSISSRNIQQLILTASTGGKCRLWLLDHQRDDTAAISSNLLAEAICCRKQIASACLLLPSLQPSNETASLSASSYGLVVGDSKGGLTIFDCSSIISYVNTSSVDIHDTEMLTEAVLEEFWSMPNVHGKDPINSIQVCGGGFCTLGADGIINIFCFVTYGKVILTTKLYCDPITTPEALFLSTGADGSLSVIVGGFQGSQFLVWDVSHHQQLMAVEGGGWKRSHCCTIQDIQCLKQYDNVRNISHCYPLIVFAYACPRKPENEQQAIDDDILTNLVVYHSESSSDINVNSRLSPLRLGCASHGKVCYCATILNCSLSSNERSFWLLSGGESGIIKSFHLSSLKFDQDLHMPHNVPVRAIAHSKHLNSACGIIVGAGGRLNYRIWRYESTLSVSDKNSSIPLEQRLQYLFGLKIVCVESGTTWNRATQDHRILCTSCIPVPSIDNDTANDHLLLLGDSRGVAVVSLICERGSHRMKVLDEFTVSECPLLCCKILFIPLYGALQLDSGGNSNVMVAFIGDTSGTISIWQLPERSVASNDTQKYVIYFCFIHFILFIHYRSNASKAKYLGSYSAHAMGCNCIDAIVESTTIDSCPRAEASTNPCVLNFGVLISSGGDDQAITLCRGKMTVNVSV